MTADDTVKWVTAAELPHLILSENTARARPFFESFVAGDPLVDNIVTDGHLLRVGQQVFPVTVNEGELDNSWVCSPYNATVTYPLEELRHIDSVATRFALAGLIHSIAPLVRTGRLNKSVCVNNCMLSTNLYPEVGDAILQEVTAGVRSRFPEHAILFRSLNAVTNEPLLQSLRRAGYLLAPSRQVYLFDGREPDYFRHANTKRDLKLLTGGSGFTPVSHDEIRPTDFARIRELYDLLYLQKYSFHNPQFSERLLQMWHASDMMTYFGLKNAVGRLDAIVGTFAVNGVLTAPVVGYDTSQPQRQGLYRMLMAHVLQKATDDRMLLNLSAGAPSFKRLRGGRPELEYSAVYCQHLPLRQRVAWKSLATLLNQIGGRILQRYEL